MSLVFLLCTTGLFAADDAATNKTLVAWVIPANLTQQGSSTLTIQSSDLFDAVVFGERARGRWMAGSNFFQRTEANQSRYPAETADDLSCANMLNIGDRWMLLCISHTLGCRYYLGDCKDEKYLPEFHAMMSFDGNQFFAPESMLTRDGRRVMWAWLLRMPIAPTGVESLPRELELPADGVLRIRPLREPASLRQDEKSWSGLTVKDGAEHELEDLAGNARELEVTFNSPVPRQCGIQLLADDSGEGGIRIIAGADRKTLKVGTIEAPFALKAGEDLTLRVFLDKNLVEVFANDRQAAVYAQEQIRENPNIRLFATGGDAAVKSVKAWSMKTIYGRTATVKAAGP